MTAKPEGEQMGQISKEVEQKIAALEQDAARRYPDSADSAYKLAFMVGAMQGILRAFAQDADAAQSIAGLSQRFAQGLSGEQAYELVDGIRQGVHMHYVDESPATLQDAEFYLNTAYESLSRLWDETDAGQAPDAERDMFEREAA